MEHQLLYGFITVQAKRIVDEGASNKEDCLEEVVETTFYVPAIPKTTLSVG